VVKMKNIIYNELMVEIHGQINVYNIEIDSDEADWLYNMDPHDRFLQFIWLNIYGVPVILNDELEEAYYEGDTSKFSKIGRLTGYYIPFDEILEEGENPVLLCDDVSADLGFIATIFKDYYEENNLPHLVSLFYIDELEIYKQYRRNGFGSKILQELPYLLDYHKGINISDLAYYPAPTHFKEKIYTPYEQALMKQIADKMNKFYNKESTTSKGERKLIALERQLSTEEIEELIENEKNTPSYDEEYKNINLYRFYEKNGFKEFKETRLLIKSLYYTFTDK